MSGAGFQIDNAPIFIGGVAGSGKTRLGARLKLHSRISLTRRTYLWRQFYGRFGDLSRARDRQRCLEAVLASPGVQALDVDPDEIRAAAGSALTYGALFALVHDHHARNQGKPRWCDQLGLVEAYADPIFDSFPDARFIHMIGDPRDPVTGRERPGEVGWKTGKWLTSVELAQRNESRHGAGYLVLLHEELLDDEGLTVKKVCEFLNEPFEESMIEDRADSGATIGFTPDRFGPRHRFVQTHTGEHMKRHGYTEIGAAPRRRSGPSLADWPADRLALAAWRRGRARAMARKAAMRP